MRSTPLRFREMLLILLGLVAAAVMVFLPDWVGIPVPLYLIAGEMGPLCCAENIPRLPVAGITAGLVFASMIEGSPLRIGVLIRGLVLGAVGTAYAALIGLLPFVFGLPYIATSYRLYAVAYAIFASAALAYIAIEALRSRTELMTRPHAYCLVGVLFLTLVGVTVERSLPAAASVVLGAGIASVLSLWGIPPRLRRRQLPPYIWVAAVCLTAFLVRVAFGLQTLARTGPGMAFAVDSDDGDYYYRAATLLAADPTQLGEVLWNPVFPPAYAIFVGAIFAATGENMAILIVIQAVLAALACATLYLLGSRLAGRTAGVVAAALFALDTNLIQNSVTLTAESLFIPLLLASIYFLPKQSSRPGWPLVASGVTAGGAFLARNVAALPWVAVALMWLIVRKDGSRLTKLKEVAVFAVTVLVVLAPVGVATYARDGSVRLTTQQAALAYDFVGGLPSTVSNALLIERGIRPFSDPLGSLARFISDPVPVIGFLIGSAPQRIGTLLFSPSPGTSDPISIVNSVEYPHIYGDMLRLLLLLGLLLGLVTIVRHRVWRRAPEAAAYLAYAFIYLCIFTFVFAPYHAFRYRIPVEPIRLLVEAVGVLVLVAWIHRNWWNRTVVLPFRSKRRPSPPVSAESSVDSV